LPAGRGSKVGQPTGDARRDFFHGCGGGVEHGVGALPIERFPLLQHNGHFGEWIATEQGGATALACRPNTGTGTGTLTTVFYMHMLAYTWGRLSVL
jgi:hypothetical protein